MSSKAPPPTDNTVDAETRKIRKIVADEIQKQLAKAKEEIIKKINEEIVRDLKSLKARIMEDVRAEIRQAQICPTISSQHQPAETSSEDVRAEIKSEMQLVRKDINSQLALAQKKQIDASINVAKREIYQKIMGNINKELVPKINSMAEWVSYHTQDAGEIITDYRRAVYNQDVASGMRALPSGDAERDKKVQFQQGLFFFTEND